MRRPRDIIKHVCVEVAKARRRCHRDDKHSIARGERCLVISEGSLAGSRNYCVACALEILGASESKHARLRLELSASHQTTTAQGE